MRLALFDMDCTLAEVDTTVDFVKRNVSLPRKAVGFPLAFLLMGLYRIGTINDTRAKNTLYPILFRGWSEERFRKTARRYNDERLPEVLKPAALERLRWHQSRGDRVAVVSGTIDLLVAGWCAEKGIVLLANTMEFHDGRVTGRMGTRNCYGPEKGRRIREYFDLKEYERIYAYGDSSGDREMLALAHEPAYRRF
ncbi:MAG: HAD-IB family hydrolase [Spirochaetes bacterium]|nr:HAD-IB family hydrolase [Spirochaetota bacterium]